MSVLRCYSQKKTGFDVEAQGLLGALRDQLGIRGLESVVILNRYDADQIDPAIYEQAKGIVFSEPTIEFSYKNDDLHDPLMNAYHAVALKLATWEEIELIKKYAFAVNDTLKAFWSECGVTLVDFKLEFGKTVDGQIVLADEISPDTCRLWDSKTNEKLDKDRFRRDLGGVEDAYAEVMKRLMAHDAQ